MKTRCPVMLLLLLSVVVTNSAEMQQPAWFSAAARNTGNAYRAAITNLGGVQDVSNQLEAIIQQESPNGANARQARILLARIQYPGVFSECEEELLKWRKMFPVAGRPGFLSGMLLQFTQRGPENKIVEEFDRDENGKIRHAPVPRSDDNTNTNKLHIMQAVRKKVEKYTDAEVQAGIARNAAARQAVLEHLLKFLDEGPAYEQSELVEFVYRVWCSDSYERRKEEPTAFDLIEAVYKDESRPFLVRYTAAMSLPPDKQQGIQNLMLNIVTNANNTSEDLTGRALGNLESTGDASTLAILKSQTNGPAWKLQKIEKTSQVIDARLSKK